MAQWTQVVQESMPDLERKEKEAAEGTVVDVQMKTPVWEVDNWKLN